MRVVNARYFNDLRTLFIRLALHAASQNSRNKIIVVFIVRKLRATRYLVSEIPLGLIMLSKRLFAALSSAWCQW